MSPGEIERLREEIKRLMQRQDELMERQIRLEKDFRDHSRFWMERVAYISIIVGLLVALLGL